MPGEAQKKAGTKTETESGSIVINPLKRVVYNTAGPLNA
jgi:hypothetical protein